MKALVTGGCGFIGSALVRELEKRQYAVTVFDALTYAGNPQNIAGTRAELVTGDVRDEMAVRNVIRAVVPDAVFHLAADSHVQRSFADQRRFLETNAIGTEHVLAAASAAGVPHLLHVSTDEVFGDVLGGRVDEEGAIRPRNPYSASKAAAECVVHSYRNWKDYPVTMVRLSNCYGPRQHVEKLIPLTIARLLAGLPALVHGDGQQVRDWLHVKDAARGIADALERGVEGDTYNLPGREELSVMRVVKMITEQVNGGIQFSADRPGHADRRYGMQGRKAQQRFGWDPQICFAEGLLTTIAWYLGNKDRALIKEAV